MNNYVKRFRTPFLSKNITATKLYTIEGEEIELVKNILKRIIRNVYVKTSDLSGILKYEQMLGIKPNSEYSLEVRRNNILHKMLFKAPFTKRRLNSILYSIYGRGGYVFEVFENQYECIIDITTMEPEVYLQFSDEVRKVIPANIYLIFSIQYTYFYLSKNYKYGELEELTYGELSRYAE